MRILNCVPTQDAEGTLAERAMSDPKLVVGVGPSLVPEQIIFQGNVLSTNSQGAAMYVSVACQRLRIIKIAVADNEFECIFTLHLRWVDNYADGRSAEDTERAQDWIGDWKPEWDPLIEFTNIARPASLLRSNYKIDDEGFVRAFLRYQGQFLEAYQLHSFPWDRHFLHIRLQSLRLAKDVQLTPYQNYSNTVESSLIPSWDMSGAMDVQCATPQPDNPFYFHTAAIRLPVERHSWHFISSYIAPSALIVLLSLTSFLEEPTQFSSRCGILMTMLLTLVAIRFLAMDHLPKIGYSTKLDIYMQSGFITMFIASLVQIVSKAVTLKTEVDLDTIRRVDGVCAATLVVAWVLAHLVFAWMIRAGLLRRPWKIIEEKAQF